MKIRIRSKRRRNRAHKTALLNMRTWKQRPILERVIGSTDLEERVSSVDGDGGVEKR